jgi:hypothetical protein
VVSKRARSLNSTLPKEAYTISSSFFLGLFGQSVVRAGSRDAFLKRFEFDAPDFMRGVIDSYIGRALQQRNLF